MKPWPQSETAVGAPVLDWFKARGWECFCEVQPWSSGQIADIVARRGNLLWIVEAKRAATLAVLEQASRWLGYAHLVSVAVPRSHTGRGPTFERVAEWMGLGVFIVYELGDPMMRVGRLHRRPVDRVADCLCDEQRNSAPGSTAGGQFTPFKGTAQAVVAAVKSRPGMTLKELMGAIERNHYANDDSARSGIVRAVRAGWIEGVRLEREGKRIRLYPAE